MKKLINGIYANKHNEYVGSFTSHYAQWPYASTVEGADFIIENNTVPSDRKTDTEVPAIYDASGARGVNKAL